MTKRFDVHVCGRCKRFVSWTEGDAGGWFHIATNKWQDEQCVRAIPEYLYNKDTEEWKEKILKEFKDSDFEINLPHVDHRLLEGRWNPKGQPYSKVTITIENEDRTEVIEIHKAKGVSFGTTPILETDIRPFSMVVYDTQRLKAQLNLEAIFDDSENRILVHRVTTIGKEIKDEQ